MAEGIFSEKVQDNTEQLMNKSLSNKNGIPREHDTSSEDGENKPEMSRMVRPTVLPVLSPMRKLISMPDTQNLRVFSAHDVHAPSGLRRKKRSSEIESPVSSVYSSRSSITGSRNSILGDSPFQCSPNALRRRSQVHLAAGQRTMRSPSPVSPKKVSPRTLRRVSSLPMDRNVTANERGLSGTPKIGDGSFLESGQYDHSRHRTGVSCATLPPKLKDLRNTSLPIITVTPHEVRTKSYVYLKDKHRQI